MDGCTIFIPLWIIQAIIFVDYCQQLHQENIQCKENSWSTLLLHNIRAVSKRSTNNNNTNKKLSLSKCRSAAMNDRMSTPLREKTKEWGWKTVSDSERQKTEIKNALIFLERDFQSLYRNCTAIIWIWRMYSFCSSFDN